jgi:thioredoxin reductase (NADPH)
MEVVRFIARNFTAITIIGILFFVIWRALNREAQTKAAKKLIKKAESTGMNEPLTLHPEIDPALCAGCGACTRVCPEGDILQLVNHKAKLVSPTKCVGHGECEKACPLDAITLVFGTKTRGMDIPRLSSNYETNVPGLYIAGELGGMGLIRNAIKQGVLASSHAISKLGTSKAKYDLLIVGAGPAGLSAAVNAIANKKSYLLIEQNSFGGTVYNFPRQKVVMSHPFELPLVGKKQFDSNKVSKEQLLEYWDEVRKKTGLKINEGTTFVGLKKEGQSFVVTTQKGDFEAEKVLLCMGVRGSPRKLGVPGEGQSKVTYNLLDPEQYIKKNVVVVGGGNAGVEAAQMLGDPKVGANVHLLVRSGTFDRCNEDNINRINAMADKGLVKIWYNSSVTEILEKEIRIKKEASEVVIDNDYVFVFAGAEMPHKFLMSLGVEIDKKFGQGLADPVAR